MEAHFQYYRTAVAETDTGNGIGRICEDWVEWRGKGFCDVAELKNDLELSLEAEEDTEGNSSLGASPRILSFDHIQASQAVTYSVQSSPPPAILYISSFSASFADLYLYLLEHSKIDTGFSFIVRYRPPESEDVAAEDDRAKVSVKGYGVEMVMKKTDYLVVDDRDIGDAQVPLQPPRENSADHGIPSRGSLSVSDDVFRDILGDDPWSELAKPLKPSQVAGLGIQAASLIQSSSDPLEALVHLSQDFPRYSAALARRVDHNEDLLREVEINQMSARLGDSVWINGRNLKSTEMNAFKLLEIIREERQRALALTELGLTPDQAFDLLTDETIGEAQTQQDPMAGLVDASDREEGGHVIIWWNNIEKDKKYAGWTTSINPLVRPTQQGAFQNIRRNLWNVVLVLDMSDRSAISAIAQTISTLIQRNLPLRFGVVPMIGDEDDSSLAMGRLMRWSVANLGRAQTIQWLRAVFTTTVTQKIDIKNVERIWQEVSASTDRVLPSFKDIISGNSGPEGEQSDQDIQDVKAWLKRTATSKVTGLTGHVFLNGKHQPFNEMWTQTMMQDYMNQLSYLIQPVRLSDFLILLFSVADRRTLLPPSERH